MYFLWIEQISRRLSYVCWTLPFPFGLQPKCQNTEPSQEVVLEGHCIVCCSKTKRVCVLWPFQNSSRFWLGSCRISKWNLSLPISLHPHNFCSLVWGNLIKTTEGIAEKSVEIPPTPIPPKITPLLGVNSNIQAPSPIPHSSLHLWFIRTTTRLGLP